MSDHDPNGDDDFMKGRRDDSNMGHQSVPGPMRPRMHTMAYSIVTPEEAQRRHGGSAVAPTEEMVAVAAPLTVYDIISGILEVDMEAWKKLPTSVQKLMLSEPASFKFHKFESMPGTLVPDIIYNGVRIRYADDKQLWVLYEIETK